MRMFRFATAIVASLSLAATIGCRSTGPTTFKVSRLDRGDLAPTFSGRRLKQGGRAAVVAFNCVVWSPLPEGAEELNVTQRLSPDDLRQLTDAMFATFMDELRQVHGLELMPVSRIATNRYYHELDYRPGDKSTGVGLGLEASLARKVAPVGLKYIPVPHSEVDARLHGDLEDLAYRFENLNQAFEDDMNRLTWHLGVDYTIFVNSLVTVTPGPNGGAEGSVKVVEVLIMGKDDHTDWAYNEYYAGDFQAAAVTPPPVAQATVDLIRAPNDDHLTAAVGATSPWWHEIAGPYRQVANVFRQRLNELRQ